MPALLSLRGSGYTCTSEAVNPGREMLIVDAQQNIAFNAQQLGRDYTAWAWRQRRELPPRDAPIATTSFRDNLLAGVAVVVGGIAVLPESAPDLKSWQRFSYRTQDDAQRLARGQLDYYHRLADEHDQIQLILTQSDLAAVLESWQGDKAIDQRLQGIVVQLKGAEPISEPKQFEAWHGAGVRLVAPAWGPSRYAAVDGDLTRLGYELLEALASAGALLDIVGLSERGAADAIDRYAGPVIASHGSPRQICGVSRCISDAAIIRLAERGGVLGIMMYNRYLRRDWHPADPKRSVSLQHWVNAVDHVCQLTGSVDHVGLGSDIDGGYAYSALPRDVDTSSDLRLLERALLEGGFSTEETAAILGGNMLRVLTASLPDE